jgi:DNA invertase Pin-like site-specific DNA recombinase
MLLGYVRISTADQSLHLQRDALLAAGVEAERIYEDVLSGRREDRPGLEACLKALQPGNTLVVWKLDRLGRSTKHLLVLLDGLTKRGVGFRSLQEAIDTTTPMGQCMVTILAAFAQLERDILVERTKAGLVAAKARGRQGGRRPKLTPDQLLVVRQLARYDTTNITALAKSYGVDRSTIYRALRQQEDGLLEAAD